MLPSEEPQQPNRVLQMKCKLYLQAALGVFIHARRNTWYMPGTLLCLEEATLRKIISPCPQRGGGRDKIVSQSDNRTPDGEARTNLLNVPKVREGFPENLLQQGVEG